MKNTYTAIANCAAVGLVLMVLTVGAGRAATINVAAGEVNVAANGQCSLREAILNANGNNQSGSVDCPAGAGASDTIQLAANSTYTVTDVGFTQDGGNAFSLISSIIIIEGNGSIIGRSTAGGTPDFRFFRISAAGSLTVNNATLRNGNVPVERGGAIFSQGALTLDKTTVSNNQSGTAGTGFAGGIYSTGTLIVTNSTISGNSAPGIGFGGGAMCICGGSADITNTTISGNSTSGGSGGGFIASGSSTVNLNFVTISGNSSNDNNGMGGGGYSTFSGTTTNLKNSIVSGNSSNTTTTDIFGAMISRNYNHIGNTSGAFFTLQPNDTTGALALGALANNGGLTQTRLPPAASASVIDAIPVNTNGCQTGTGVITLDQRAASRAADSNGDGTAQCEKGAVELGAIRLGIQAAGEPADYDFLAGANLLRVAVTDDGTNFDALRVTDFNVSSPNAPSSIQTGRYWTITPLQSNLTTQATADYTVDLTLPYSLADSMSRVCRYTGSGMNWDCAVSSFVANTSVTRTGITQLSDWAVQNPALTAATVNISGRVLVGKNRGLMNAFVSLTDANGVTRTARSSAFGYYRFEEVGAGETYIIAVNSKRYSFAPQAVFVTEELENLDLTALP